MAHEPSIEICRKAASNLLESQKSPEDKEKLEKKLEELNNGWSEIETLLADRLNQLNNALDDSREFQNQVREMIGWLNEGKAFLKSKLPVGGKPETAKMQLEKHGVSSNSFGTANRISSLNVWGFYYFIGGVYSTE